MNSNQPPEIPPQCERCGSSNLRKGSVVGTTLIGFLPKGSKLSLSAIPMDAIACEDCGCVFNFELNPKFWLGRK